MNQKNTNLKKFQKMSMTSFSETNGLSFSKLSKLADGPISYKANLEEEKPFSLGIAFGSVVDVLLTCPEKFNDEFYVMQSTKPASDMMATFCEIYAETNNIEKAYNESNFKISVDRVLSKFETEGKDYYESLIKSKGKKVIDINMMFAANQTVTMLKSNSFTKIYFQESDNIEILKQFPIIWKENIYKLPTNKYTVETIFKGIIDIIRIDHKLKTIEIIDIKTGAEGFRKSLWKYKLYLQAAMYYYGLKEFIKDTDLKDYEVLNTKFIYCDSNLYYPPIVYKMTDYDLMYAKNSYYTKFSSNSDQNSIPKLKYKGYERLASELIWHLNNNQWDYPYEVYQSNGEIELDLFVTNL